MCLWRQNWRNFSVGLGMNIKPWPIVLQRTFGVLGQSSLRMPWLIDDVREDTFYWWNEMSYIYCIVYIFISLSQMQICFIHVYWIAGGKLSSSTAGSRAHGNTFSFPTCLYMFLMSEQSLLKYWCDVFFFSVVLWVSLTTFYGTVNGRRVELSVMLYWNTFL